MTKQVKKISDTQMLRQGIPLVLKEKYKDGATFEELWEALYKDKKLAKIMINSRKEKRLGLLQGLSNRIKDDKEDNLMLVKKDDGKNYFVYCNNSIEKLTKLTENFIKTAEMVDFKADSNLTKVKEELINKHISAVVNLSKINNELIGVNKD